MDLLPVKMSTHASPSQEGSASALFMVEKLIHLLTMKDTEFEALEAPKNTSSSSSNLIISPSNINSIDIGNIPDFTSKAVQVLEELQRLKCISWKFQIVRNDFYSQDIEFRAKHILKAPSVDYLCKSLLMKNTKCLNNDCSDPLNSKYYLVLVQYDKKLKQQKCNVFATFGIQKKTTSL